MPDALYVPWKYDSRNRWWTARYGGLLASVTHLRSDWIAGFNGKPLTSFYDEQTGHPLTDRFIFQDPFSAIAAVNEIAARLGFERLEVPDA